MRNPKILGRSPFWTWEAQKDRDATTLPSNCNRHSACDYEGAILSFEPTDDTPHMQISCFKADANAWSTFPCVGDLPPSLSCTAVANYHSYVWMFGGIDRASGKSINSTYRLSVLNCQWQHVRVRGEIPCPRNSHSLSTLNGNMFLFGGWDEGVFFDDVNVLHSHGTVWSEVALPKNMARPCGRIGHSACVFRSSIFVFGGFHSPHTVGDLWEFNTISSEWVEISAPGGPSDRYRHSGVVIGDTMIIFGGISSKKQRFNDIHLFDLVRKTWTRLSDLPFSPCPRSFHQAVLIEGAMYVFGGSGDSGKLTDTYRLITPEFKPLLIELPPDSGTWNEIRSSGAGVSSRTGHICFVYREELFVFGGTDKEGETIREMAALDLRAATWRTVPIAGDIPFGVCGAKIACMSESVLLCGGYFAANGAKTFISDLFHYSILESRWTRIECENIFHPRADHSVVIMKNELYVIGGVYQKQIFGDMYKLPLDSGVWQPIECGPSPRFGHTAVSSDSSIIMFGGWDGNMLHNDLWIFQDGGWTTVSPGKDQMWPPPLYRHASVMAKDCMYVFGGVTSNQKRLNDLFRFCMKSRTWSLVEVSGPNIPIPRVFHEMVTYQSDVVHLVVFGGRADNKLGDVWSFSLTEKMDTVNVEKNLPSPSVEIEKLRKRIMELESKVICKVCMEKDINSVLIPCAHRCVCLSCAAIIVNGECICPICREKILRLVETIDA